MSYYTAIGLVVDTTSKGVLIVDIDTIDDVPFDEEAKLPRALVELSDRRSYDELLVGDEFELSVSDEWIEDLNGDI